MIVDVLLSRLEGVKRLAPGKWVAKCPAHKDRRASLSVRETEQGIVLCHCFAGCSISEVLAAVNMDFDALFPPSDGVARAAPAVRRPFSIGEVIAALGSELGVAWVLLTDMASGREINAADRRRAGVAKERCIALIDELRRVR